MHEHEHERQLRGDDEHRGERAGNRHDRADRKIDAARGDDQRHAEREEHDLRALVEDIDESAVEVAVLNDKAEKGGCQTRLKSSSAASARSGQRRPPPGTSS